MIASATKGELVSGSGLMQESQKPISMRLYIERFLCMAPSRRVARSGIKLELLTM